MRNKKGTNLITDLVIKLMPKCPADKKTVELSDGLTQVFRRYIIGSSKKQGGWVVDLLSRLRKVPWLVTTLPPFVYNLTHNHKKVNKKCVVVCQGKSSGEIIREIYQGFLTFCIADSGDNECGEYG